MRFTALGVVLSMALGTLASQAVEADAARRVGAKAARIVGVNNGACRVAIDTDSNIVIINNVQQVVSSVDVLKPCAGLTIGNFASEVATAAGGQINVQGRATCIATGGFVGACTV